MKPKFWPVFDMCIESGTQLGLSRAFKHDDNPSHEVIVENVTREIMNQLYEWFDMEEINETL